MFFTSRRAKAAQFFINTVLESVAEDAWKDALISVAMDYSVFGDNRQMLTNFKDLGMYLVALGDDLVNFHEAPKSDLHPLDGGHFIYGWWFNCPHGSGGERKSKCLAPFVSLFFRSLHKSGTVNVITNMAPFCLEL